MVERRQVKEPLAKPRRHPADVAVWMCVVLTLSAVAIATGEQALERQIAACSSSRAVLVERMIIATVILSIIAILAGAVALIGRSRGWVGAVLGIFLAAVAGWIAIGGYQCYLTTP